ADYASTTADHFQCPQFPFTHPKYNPKFEVRAATYGYNINLGNGFLPQAIPRRRFDVERKFPKGVVMFVDAVQFEMTPAPTAAFNEGHYVSPAIGHWGYAHFRHKDNA